MGLKLLLKRGGLLAAANWPTVAVQFAAQITFQMLLAVPIVGAAILVAVLLGGDLTNLLQGNLRDTFTSIADALMAEPTALVAFITAFGIVLVGGSILMFLVKGGTVAVMLAADAAVGPIEREPVTIEALSEASVFSASAFVAGCQRLFRRYLLLGVVLMLAYGVTGAAYVGFAIYGYRAAAESGFILGWTLIGAVSTVALVLWITAINLIYLLVQIAAEAENSPVSTAMRSVARFVRAEFLDLGAIFLVVFGMVVAATLASALAWTGVAFIAFVPLVGLAVVPLQIAALLVRGLVFEYIGLTAMGSYVTLYRRYSAGLSLARQVSPASASRAAPAR